MIYYDKGLFGDKPLPDARKVGKKRRWSWIARIVVAAAAMLWVFHGQDWGKLAAAFHRLSAWWFAFTLAVFIVAQIAVALRWWLLLRAQSIHIGILAAIRLSFLGLFYNNAMPGSVGGDLLKAWYVTKHTHRKTAGVLSVFVDRAVGLATLILIAIPVYGLFVRGRLPDGPGTTVGISQYARAVFGSVVVIGLILGLVLVHPTGREKLRRVVGHLWLRGLTLLQETKDAVVIYCSKPGMLLLAIVLTLFSQSTVILAFWLLGRNLGVEANLRHYFVVFPVMWVVSAVPVSIGGLGVFEAGVVQMFGRLAGVSVELGMVLALCQRFVWVLTSLPGGVIHLLGAHLPRDEISVDCQEAGN